MGPPSKSGPPPESESSERESDGAKPGEEAKGSEKRSAGGSTSQRKGTRSRSAEPSEAEERSVIQALAHGLREVVPGFEILDRDLMLDEGGRADLAGVDAAGRPVLVLLAGSEPERTALEVLDTLSFTRRHASLLIRHLGSSRLREGAIARVIVVLAAQDPALAARLLPLQGRGLEILGIRSLSSSSGERSYLVPLSETGTGDVPRAPASMREAFFAELPVEQRDLCGLLARRMGRLDDELEVDASPAGILWSFQGEPLAQVEEGDGGLRGGVAPSFVARRIAGEMDIERFLEAAMSRLAELLGGGGAADREGGEAGLEGRNLLTPEEMAAFRD